MRLRLHDISDSGEFIHIQKPTAKIVTDNRLQKHKRFWRMVWPPHEQVCMRWSKDSRTISRSHERKPKMFYQGGWCTEPGQGGGVAWLVLAMCLRLSADKGGDLRAKHT
jgi:hypothetical protein